MTSVLEAARDYRQRGLSVIPVRPRDKRALVEWAAYQEEPPHPDQIEVWWEAEPAAGVAIVTGRVSGLVVLDFDGLDGQQALRELSVPASTWVARTPHGLHAYFAHPGEPVANGARVRPGFDVRGDGGYCVAPPSIGASGHEYAWLTAPTDLPLAPLPENIRTLLRERHQAPPNGHQPTADSIPSGARNDTLYKLGRSLVAKGLTVAGVTAALLEENRSRCAPPLGEAEVRAIAAHVVSQPDRPTFTAAAPAVDNQGLALVSVGELLGELDVGPAWLVEGRLPAGGLGMLAGKPKAGKSTTARCLALKVARGAPWLSFATTQGPVIYLALEEKRQEVRAHFRTLGAVGSDPIYILCASAPADALARLRREVERRRPVLIIIDPLFRLVRVPAEGGNDYPTMSAALEPLLVLARESGAHVLVVHHLGKGERVDGDAILGSTAIFAAVDTALLLKRSQRHRTLASLQRYGDDLEEITVELDPETRDVVAGVPRAEAELADAGRLLLAFFASASAAVTEAELDGAIECRRQVWKKALRVLVGTGEVVRSGHGGKSDPFRYRGSLVYAGTREPEDLFPAQLSVLQQEDSGSRSTHSVVVPKVPVP